MDLEREVVRVRVMGNFEILMVWLLVNDFKMVLGKCDKEFGLLNYRF